MAVYTEMIFPLLTKLDAEYTHRKVIALLEIAQKTGVGRRVLSHLAGSIPSEPVEAFGLVFPNRIGLAAGFDKDARVPKALALLGFGHIEVGTLTPRAQEGNKQPRIFRLAEDGAIINRMGFPNQGAKPAQMKLANRGEIDRLYILGASVGKQKETDLREAVGDYISVMERLYGSVDYFAINVSSPNTPGLRELQSRRYIDNLFTEIMRANGILAQKNQMNPRPVLVKISPDLEWNEVDAIIEAALHCSISGLIATNTTTGRPGLHSRDHFEEGGLSGQPLKARSNEIIRYITDETQGQLPVIGTGGVSSAAEVREKLEAGAVLVQIYTGMIYKGPSVVGSILRDLSRG